MSTLHSTAHPPVHARFHIQELCIDELENVPAPRERVRKRKEEGTQLQKM
jgi:hypothetical protein